jgi:Mrp family chromosome partitioning ATPase
MAPTVTASSPAAARAAIESALANTGSPKASVNVTEAGGARLEEQVRSPAGVPLDAIESLGHELIEAGESGRRIAVLGAHRNMGTTIAAITLARSLAQHARVVLVDLALEAPNVAAVASEAGRPGIIELVNEATTFGEAITRDRYSRAHLITAGRAVGNTSAIIGSQRLVLTLEALARSYDHVVMGSTIRRLR